MSERDPSDLLMVLCTLNPTGRLGGGPPSLTPVLDLSEDSWNEYGGGQVDSDLTRDDNYSFNITGYVKEREGRKK